MPNIETERTELSQTVLRYRVLVNEVVEKIIISHFAVDYISQITTEDIKAKNENFKFGLVHNIKTNCFFIYMSFAIRLLRKITQSFCIEKALSDTAKTLFATGYSKKLLLFPFATSFLSLVSKEWVEKVEYRFDTNTLRSSQSDDKFEISPNSYLETLNFLKRKEAEKRSSDKTRQKFFIFEFSNFRSESELCTMAVVQTIRYIFKECENDWKPSKEIVLYREELLDLMHLNKLYLDQEKEWTFDLQGEILQEMIFLILKLNVFNQSERFVINMQLKSLFMWKMKYTPSVWTMKSLLALPPTDNLRIESEKQSLNSNRLFLRTISLPHTQISVIYEQFKKDVFSSEGFLLSNKFHAVIQNNLPRFENSYFNRFELRIILASIAAKIITNIQSPKNADSYEIIEVIEQKIKFNQWISVPINEGRFTFINMLIISNLFIISLCERFWMVRKASFLFHVVYL